MKYFKKALSATLSLIVAATILYVDIIYAFPTKIIMHSGETHSAALGSGITIGNIPKNSGIYEDKTQLLPTKTGEYEATLKIADSIPYKKVKLKVTAPQSVYASGELIGLRIYNKGLIVLRTSSISTKDGEKTPAKNAGIREGDIITKINGKDIVGSESVEKLLSEKNEVNVTFLRNGREKSALVNLAYDKENNTPHLGLWVRDSTAGVGTLTYFDENKYFFGALGHSISDSDTGVLFDVSKGSIEKSKVASLKKGEKGAPGEICGAFYDTAISGTIETNCEAGVFGKLSQNASFSGTLYPIGVMSQIEQGEAKILSTVDNSIKEYDVTILRTMPFGNAAKGLVIKITDEELLQKTGGIVQGMSGSPIIQNGKIIGAVTHVLVNDPTCGYGIFIENMLAEEEKIK